MARWLGFCGPSYTAKSRIAAYDESVNLFCERVESGTGEADYTLYQAPGYQTVLTLGDSPGRGSLAIGDLGYLTAAGTTFFQAFTSRGTISNLVNGPVYMVTNGVAAGQVLIASDNNTYAFDLNTHTFASVGSQTSTAYPTSIGFLGTYGLRLDPALSQVQFSSPNDLTAWNALDVFDREDQPDRWMRLIVYSKQVWIFGEFTTSIYYLSDDTANPFLPVQSAFIEVGIAAVASACIVGGDLMWIGQSASGAGIVYRAQGYTPVRVSTFAVEHAISTLGGFLGRAQGSTYTENGHVFYVLDFTFPEDVEGFPGISLVYDTTTGLWHKRGRWTGLDYAELDARDYFNTGDENNPQIFALSRTTGKIYQQSALFYTGTDGTGIRWMRRAPHLTKENKGCIIYTVELKFEPGVAAATGAGSDPHFSLRVSKNGGQTWSNTRTKSAGLIGQFDVRAIWDGLGYGRDRLIEIAGSDPIFTPIIDAFVDARFGVS